MCSIDVEILLATYYPDKTYFPLLLQSLNRQSYRNIRLSVVDDSGNDAAYAEICSTLQREITSFPYRVEKNPLNIGSNKTFERLTKEATCGYLAYCDQDDIWEANKIQRLVDELGKRQAALCYSDLSIIDQNGKLIAQSFKDINKRLLRLEGAGQFSTFLRRNSVSGCTILIPAAVAAKAIPFCNEYYVYDQWLALIASTYGPIAYVEEPLVQYRIHGKNQIGKKVLQGIEQKSDYLTERLQKEIQKYEFLLANGAFNPPETQAIRKTLAWVQVRTAFFQKHSFVNTAAMLKALPVDPSLILFELFLAFAPRALSGRVIRRLQRDNGGPPSSPAPDQ